MKLILTSVFALFITLGFSQVVNIEYETIYESHEGHDHSTYSSHDILDEEERLKLLKDFDYSSADIDFSNLNLHIGEKEGWLRTKEDEYISKKFPQYFNSKRGKLNTGAIPVKSAGCPNAGFEDLVFAPQWEGGIGNYSTANNPPITNTTIVSNGLNAANNDPLARHTIMTTPAGLPTVVTGYDPLAFNAATGEYEIPVVAPLGGGASVRLGNRQTGGGKDRLTYTLNVTAQSTAFYYQYALIIEDPSNTHTIADQPRFNFDLLDSVGTPIGAGCGVYEVVSSQAAADPSFTQSAFDVEVFYRKWARVNLDLSPYIGQTVKLQFEVRDCGQSGHFGYVYLDAGCIQNLNSASNLCVGDALAELVATDGFDTYQWFGPNNPSLPIAGAINDTLSVVNPIIGDTFYVQMGTSSPSGGPPCIIVSKTVIAYSTIELDELVETGTCYRGNFGEALITSTGSTAGYNYTWSNQAGTVLGTNSTGLITGLATGTYNVIINSSNVNCGADTTTFFIPTTPVLEPDSIVAKFCEGKGIILGPTNVSNYQWYTGNGNPVLPPVGNASSYADTTAFQGEIIYLSYKKSNGCYDSTVYVLTDNVAPSFFTISQNPASGCRSRQINYTDASPSSALLNYVINGPNGFNITNFNNTAVQWSYNSLALGTYDIRVIDDGCFYDTTFSITDLEDTTSSIVEFCPGTPITLIAGFAGNHNWIAPNGTGLGGGNGINTMVIPAPVEGTYYDSSQVSPGCYFVSAFHVDSTTLIASYAVNEPDCYGGFDGSITGSIVQGIGGSAFYSTTGPNGYSSNFNPATGLAAGTYTVTASVLTCTVTNEVVVGQPAFPADTLWMYTQTCDELGKSTIYAPEGFADYEWFLNGVSIAGSTADSIDINLPIDYNSIYVTYTSPWDGCEKKTTDYLFEPFSFNWNPDEFTNVFTPNGTDFVNSIYYPIYSSDKDQLTIGYLAGDYSMVIYNRWGNKVFETTNYLNGWDGTFKGSPVQDGAYFAEIMYRTLCDDKINKIVQVVQVVR